MDADKRTGTARRLLTHLRTLMASGSGQPADIVALVAEELGAEVCSVYALRAGEILELRATKGLNPAAVGRTRLRVGEGIVGLVAATGTALNLADAQNHPAFAYRPELGEEPYASMLAVAVRRGGRTLGVLTVQNRVARHYTEEEAEVLDIVAMLLADSLVAADGFAPQLGFSGSLPRQFDAALLSPGIVFGPVILHGADLTPKRLLAEDSEAELARLQQALGAMRQGLDALIDTQLPQGAAPRDILDATRQVAADDGWLRRVAEAISGGLSAEAAVHRVAQDFRARMRKIMDPYLRERLADLEDLAARLIAALDGSAITRPDAKGAILLVRRLGPAQLLEWHASGIAGVVIEEGSAGGHAAIVARALGLPAVGGARGALDAAGKGDDAVLDADEGTFILRPDPGVQAGLRAWPGRPRHPPCGLAEAARYPLAHPRQGAVHPDDECRTGAGAGPARRYRRPGDRLVPHRDRHDGPRLGARRRRTDRHLRSRAGRGRRPAGVFPHARPGQRQAAARQSARRGREPGHGLAQPARGAGPPGRAAAAAACPAAGRPQAAS